MTEFGNHTRSDLDLTVVVPVFQEVNIIVRSLIHLYEILGQLNRGFEVIIADDGSTDHCDRVISDIKDDFQNLRLVRHPRNMGRGFILTKAIQQSRGNIICYIDADLQIDPEVLPRLVRCVEKGFDIAIGSKHLPDAQLVYPRWRRIQSLVYNKLTRHLLQIDIRDFQCGAKAFRRSTFMTLLKHVTTKGWSWDTELILKGTVLGYRIVEVPVIVRPNRRRKSLVRIRSVFIMGWHLLRFWIWSKTKAAAFERNNRRV